ncbi:hypothetical protein AB9F26_05100 [Falsihalocynthiibacter sp. BN13B15]|uniref:hypothetical protein n=1 Tax=Falsihalocynthiibacter sp. BN13B15 TaxID=3240871 RepID=UPI00350F8A48
MNAEELKAGKERVRDLLIAPLVELGMKRKRGDTVEAHDKMLDNLAAILAYMDAPNLKGLKSVMIGLAGGKARDQWPSQISFLNNAKRFQEPEASDSEMVHSLIGSKAGQRAYEGGYLVEFYSDLKAGKHVLGSYAERNLRERGAANKRRLDRIRAQQDRDTALPSDLNWMAGYAGYERRALAVLEAENCKNEAGA